MKTRPLYGVSVNPALDLSGHVRALVPNEKNYVFDPRVDPGGNAVNALRMARRLGTPVRLLGFAGGATGRELAAQLAREKVTASFVTIRAATRINVTVSQGDRHEQTRLTFPGPWVTRTEGRTLIKQVQKLVGPGILVLGGSQPSGSNPRLNLEILRTAVERKLAVVVDIPAPDLKAVLRHGRHPLLMIKPNQMELEAIVGRPLRTEVEIACEARKLLRRCEIVCVSRGHRGLIAALPDGIWRFASPLVKVRGSVGAGDSLVGATVAKLREYGISGDGKNRDRDLILDALRWGVAAGAATTATEGTALGQPRLVQRLYRRVRPERLSD